MIQEKPCKGQNKAHGYEGCGKMTDVKKRTYGLCGACYWDWMSTTEGGKIHKEKFFIPRVKKLTQKEQRKKDRETRESMKSIARLINDARVPFQKWIKLRDINRACISCGTTDSDIWHAGHYLKCELYTGLIFNENNCNSQCPKCNTYLAGNEANYRIGLVKKIGEKSVLELEESANFLREYKFSRDEIKQIKNKYQKLLKEFK